MQPCTAEGIAGGVELVSPQQHPAAVGWGLLLGLCETTAEGGRDWPFQSAAGSNHP